MADSKSPDNIFQIFISDQNAEPPDILLPAIKSVQQCFGMYDYVRHDGESLRAFLEHEFDPQVVAAFDKLRPYAYKADLGRYCLLYQYGGWYADISIQMCQPVARVPDKVSMVYFFDLGDGVTPNRSLFDVSNSLIYARPRHPVMERAIRIAVRHCHQEYYGESIYAPTGPSLLGTAIAAESENMNSVCGHLMALTPNHLRRNLSFVLPDGQILALFKKGWMNPGDVLFGRREGTNNYADLWSNRSVYSIGKESRELP